MPEPILRVAAKAVIINGEGKLLVVREAAYDEGTRAGRYMIPGGRLEPGEAFLDGLRREAREETGLEDLEVIRPLHIAEWRPVIHGQEQHIIGIFMLCKTKATIVTLGEEHDDSQWIDPSQYADYNLLPVEAEAVEALLSSSVATAAGR